MVEKCIFALGTLNRCMTVRSHQRKIMGSDGRIWHTNQIDRADKSV